MLWQAQAAFQRQPFRHVTNQPMGVSPASRQQQAMHPSEGLQTGHKLQSMSLERITPTPSPVLSSSTDMPYSPSMRSDANSA